MTTMLAPTDAMTEAKRLIEVLEQRSDELVFAQHHLVALRPALAELDRCKQLSEEAVAAWQTALAHRWECEVRGRRLYKRVSQQLVDYYGSTDALEVQVFSRGGAEANSTPEELLTDLRRVEAALVVQRDQLQFAAERLAELAQSCYALDRSIKQAATCEAERRTRVLDRRMAHDACRRAIREARHALSAFYGERAAQQLPAIFGQEERTV